ncbi:MAG: DUF211 domain-containing protein, partial [Gammaproteobacteria bacterium]|nr:DUF211 domain-containing protein [Gammaproteobacteria bacterium]
SGVSAMVRVTRLVLDVLKPHHPNGLEFSRAIADRLDQGVIQFSVAEVDENTETVVLTIAGENIHYEDIEETIRALGASVHSIDEVEVVNGSEAE